MLTIGQFSKVCQVSVKALHHYDKIGLMHPVNVDRWTGYRYYDLGQIPDMLLIQRLKRYGFSLSEIADILETNDEAKTAVRLRAQMDTLRAGITETAYVISEIENHLNNFERTGNIMGYQNTYEIRVENRQETPILSLRQMMSVQEFGKYYGYIFEKAARERIVTNGMVMSLYHDAEFNPDCSDIEVAVGVADKSQATRMLEGGLTAATTHKGSYSSLPDAYGAIMRWIDENGYEVSNAPYEVYTKTSFDKLPPEQWETELYFPIKKK